MEKLADGTYLQTEVISNPGSLISGHLANEEIRQRDLENTKRKVEKDPLAIRGQHEKSSADTAFEIAKEDLHKRKIGLEAQVQTIEADKQKIVDAKKAFETDIQKLEAMVKKKEEEAQKLMDENKQLQQELETPALQGKVTTVKNDGETLFIDLGKADGIRPGVRFGVFDQDVSRIKLGKPKAVVEVVAVVTNERSRCKVVRKVGGESIAEGDGIYSAVWKPAQKVQFALVGKMDINGDGKDDREEVTKIIEREGGQVVNEPTHETRWLVLGTEIDQADPSIEKSKLLGISRINYDKLLSWLKASGDELEKK
jgi:vacuolar-type H+-ATPase subunit I/STV1